VQDLRQRRERRRLCTAQDVRNTKRGFAPRRRDWHEPCFAPAAMWTCWLGLGVSITLLVACSPSSAAERTPPRLDASAPRFATEIHAPKRLAGVPLGKESGERVRCETCHALRTDSPTPSSMEALQRFHRGQRLVHGQLTCGACHAVGQPPQLKLADGVLLPTSDALRLCTQCHGPQFRDYQHGAHGGMNGHWDLSRGPRIKNHCVDCHDPHTPALEAVQPMPPPRDRFFEPKEHH
jgi:hypothetical protein